MIAIMLLAAAVGAGLDRGPAPAPSLAPLPTIESGLSLPYPAYGAPRPQIVTTRSDPKIARLLSIGDATSIAVMRSPSLAQARAQVDFEAASLASAKTALAPSISGSASSTYEDEKPSVFDDTASLSLSQLIFDGGVVRAKIDAASLTRDASLATYRRDAQELAYDVATAFYALLQDERAVAVDRAVVAQDVVSEDLVRAQIRAGTTAGADLAQQLATTASARTALVRAQGTMQTGRVVFDTTLGLDADIDVLPRDDSQGLESATPATALAPFATELEVAYAERPDLDEAELTSRSSEASLRGARRGLSPTVSFSATTGLASTVGFAVSVPIFDQGVTHANVLSAKANLAIANAGLSSTRLTVQRDVREALIEIVSDEASLDSTRAAYQSAVSSLRSAQGQYRAGVSTLPSLIQAETTLSSAATDIVTAIYTLQLAKSNLRYALGTILQ